MPRTVDWHRYRGVLFDLDGVLTPTAEVHRAAWKRTFDQFLGVEPDHPDAFTDHDYLTYVDGKPRYDGVRGFLEARGIDLPEGVPDDPPGHDTVKALGNAKNEMFNRVLSEEGVDAYPGSLLLLDRLTDLGLALGVVSSSANAAAVLEAAGITDRFAARVDGRVVSELGLAGKPAPDAFLEGARRLGTEPDDTVVVEDAVSGVAAGRSGGFALVIGVARHGESEALADHGADLVVADLAELV